MPLDTSSTLNPPETVRRPGASGPLAQLLAAGAMLVALPFLMEAIGLTMTTATDVVVFAIAVMGLTFVALTATDAAFPAVFVIAAALAVLALVPGLRLGHAGEAR